MGINNLLTFRTQEDCMQYFHDKGLSYDLKMAEIKKLKLTLQPVMRAQWGSGGIALLFL
jgi:hypothetical protein